MDKTMEALMNKHKETVMTVVYSNKVARFGSPGFPTKIDESTIAVHPQDRNRIMNYGGQR